MYLVEVTPLTKIPLQNPQILSYFSSELLNEGSLVLVPLGKRQEKAVVIESHRVKDFKQEIKNAEYELRPIKKVLRKDSVLTSHQIDLALWLGQYYFASPGLFLKMMLSRINFHQIQSGTLKRKVEGQKLIFFPTVALLESKIKNYPPDKTVVIHSGLKTKQLNANWQKIARGEARLIIGTRLAGFAPFFNLNEILIEDETNSSYRSWDMFPYYRTHEIAKKLSELFGARLTIKSAVPSVETFYFDNQKSITLKLDTIDSKNKPKIELVDLRQELKDGNYSIFSRQLQDAVNNVLKKNKQLILFINRRGLATFVLCRDCGYVAKCSNCDAPLTYHLIRYSDSELKPLLICHHCGQKTDPPSLCPKCNSHRIKAFGSGTQRVEAEARKIFKSASILRLDSDNAPSAKEQNKIIEEFRQKKADILIGTQMILGSTLPKIPLAAIISADTLLHLPDFQSNEKTFQTIRQVKNLAQSLFIIQTYNPKSQILQIAAKQDLHTFYKNEIETRQALKYPPFSQVIKLVFTDHDPKKAAQQAKILAAKLTHQFKNSKILSEEVFEISDAVPAFISKEMGRYVWQIIIKVKSVWLAPTQERRHLLALRNKVLITVPNNWKIKIDPETLL